jgi:hypothetical protein
MYIITINYIYIIKCNIYYIKLYYIHPLDYSLQKATQGSYAQFIGILISEFSQ